MASGAQGGRGQREDGRVGESRGGRARHPWGGVGWLNYSDRTEARPSAAPAIPCRPQAGDLGEKGVDARRWAGGRASRKKYKVPESHKPDSTTCWESQETRLKVSPAEDRALPHRTVTCTGPRSALLPSAGGASAPRKRETTFSRCVRNGGCSRRSCGAR